jgi:hypothetical protein
MPYSLSKNQKISNKNSKSIGKREENYLYGQNSCLHASAKYLPLANWELPRVPYPLATDELCLSVWEASSKRAIRVLSTLCTLKRAEVAQACSLNLGWACWKRPQCLQKSCLLELARLSELRSLKRADFCSGASFLVLACHFLHKLGRISM